MAIRWMMACLALAWVTTTTAQGAYAVLKGTSKEITDYDYVGDRSMDWESDLERPYTEYLVIEYTWSAQSGFVFGRMAWVEYGVDDGEKWCETYYEDEWYWWFANVSSKSMALVFTEGGEDWSDGVMLNGAAKDSAILSLKGRWMCLGQTDEISEEQVDQRNDAKLTKGVIGKASLEEAVAVVVQDLVHRGYHSYDKGSKGHVGKRHHSRK